MKIRSQLYAALIVLLLIGWTAVAAAEPTNAVVRGDVRFEVLSPSVIRMEYSPNGKFVDATSVAVQSRTLGVTQFTSKESGGWLQITTSKLQLRYRTGSGAFGPGNLLISWSGDGANRSWKPGDKDDENLGGVPGDIAARAAPGKETGPLTRNGYYLLDDSHTAVWNSGHDWAEPRSTGANAQDWYFFEYNLDFKSFFRDMTKLVGPVPMIPRYALGTWFGSRAGYSADEWKRIIQRFHEEQVPLDVLVLDSDSTVKTIWGGRDWDLEQMPDPFGFIKYADENGVKVTVNEHYEALTPKNCSEFEHIREAMGLPPNTTVIPIDLANTKLASLYVNTFLSPALKAGLAFWWPDGNARANMTGLDPTLWTRYVEATATGRITGRRSFIFSRVGPPEKDQMPAWGAYRYGTFFTGDLVPHWSTLSLLVPFNVQAGNMLIDYPTNLTAGVHKTVVDTELYQRWMQFSALSPILWWHGVWGLRMPWEYGPGALENTRKFLQLRYSLIPYLYTYSRLAHDTGDPLVRGTYIDYPSQEAAYSFRNQYLLGSELLVAPITRSGYGKPVMKEIYLPAGQQWFDWFTGKVYEGGQVIAYECPLDRMPIFVKAGSILPLAPKMEYSSQRALNPLTVDVFAGKPTSFRLYQDDGTSQDYRTGGYSWTSLTYSSSQQGKEHTISIGPTEGHYRGQLEARSFKVLVHGLLKPTMVLLGTQTLREKQFPDIEGEGWYWDSNRRITAIDLPADVPLSEHVVLTIKGAGSFADEQLLDKVIDYRTRVRQVEVAEKLKWGLLLKGLDIKKEPRVLRETEEVEQELDNLVDSPQTLTAKNVDFKSWTAQILTSFVDRPFESNRTIPEVDPDALKATHMIEDAHFTPEEINQMTAELLGCTLTVRADGNPSPEVIGRLDYDVASLPGAHVSYEISLPDDNPPGWGEIGRTVDSRGFVHIQIQAPFPAPPGSYPIHLKAILKWNGGQAEVERGTKWVTSGDPTS